MWSLMTGELLYGGAYFKRKSIYLSQMHPLLITFSEIEKKKKKRATLSAPSGLRHPCLDLTYHRLSFRINRSTEHKSFFSSMLRS